MSDSAIADPAAADPEGLTYDAMRGVAVVAIAASPAGRDDLTAIATAHGGRVVAALDVAEVGERIARQAGNYVVLADLRGILAADADRMMRAIAAQPARPETLAIIDDASIDLAYARMYAPWIDLLVAPDAAAVRAAAALLLAPLDARLHDSGGDGNGRRLAQLSEEVGRIARVLASLSGDGVAMAASLEVPNGDPVRALATARIILRLRRLRDQFFASALFADPAWDMLLDLFAARIERRRVAVSSLCIAAAVPSTTALRWIGTMTEQGLLERHPDPEDGRRVFIALSETAASAMAAYLDAARRAMG